MYERLRRFAHLVSTNTAGTPSGELQVGVDLGTGNIVVAVVDALGNPVAGALQRSTVVKDGIVVDWLGAVEAVKKLRQQVHQLVGELPETAAVVVPPGISAPTQKIFTNVIEAAGWHSRAVVDEPVAAARALGLQNGAVIDIGHGTTGISVLCDGRTIMSTDEPTGGHHMTLVVAGALGIDYDEAENLKCQADQTSMVRGIVRPTLEKMATIAATALADHTVPTIMLVGGASSLPGTEELFSQVLGQPVHIPPHPLFPTPLGSALEA